MKKFFLNKYILAAGLIMSISACEKRLDQAPISNPSVENFYRNTADFEQAVSAAYRGLNGLDVRFMDLSEVRSDNVYAPGIAGVRDYIPINNFEPSLATNPILLATWNANYNAIMRANTVLDKINDQVVPDAATRTRMDGEARFLRAFLYFDLVRTFGRVPLVNHVVSREDALKVPRSSIEDIYTLIIQDFQKAIAQLPASWTGANRGRATSHAARAFLAQVYLTRSGPKQHPNGPTLGLNEYNQAITLLNEIIASGLFSLQPTYASVFSYTNEYNSEIIFDLEAINQGTTGDLGTGTVLPTEWYETNYATSVGITFAGGVVIDGPKEPSLDLINSFEPADVRDNFAILPSYTFQGSPVNRPQYIKFLDITKKPADRFNWPINFTMMRYADVLLMKAEAILRGGTTGTQADVDALVKLVRDRAGLSGTVLTNVTLDQLLRESRHEFISEGRRWHELVRTGKVVAVMNAFNNTEDATRSNKMFPMTTDYIIYPIPQAERSANPGLDQNPGY